MGFAVFGEGGLLEQIMAQAQHSAHNPRQWGVVELIVFTLVIQLGVEFYNHILPRFFLKLSNLPARGKHLDLLDRTDLLYITLSRIAIIFMFFHYVQFMASSSNVMWRMSQVDDRLRSRLADELSPH